MSPDTAAHVAEIRRLLHSAPNHSSWSYQRTLDCKDALAKARKLIEQTAEPKPAAAEKVARELRQFYS